MAIACLHTMESNRDIFEAAFAEIAPGGGVTLEHRVREDLLRAAGEAGGLTPAIEAETRALLEEMTGEAEAVLLTCSTLGPSVDGAKAVEGRPLLRVDAALAEAAFEAAAPRLVLCTAETTLGPTEALFRQVGGDQDFTMRFLPEAWARFLARDLDGYVEAIAEAADAAVEEGFATIALAQASMAPAAALCRRASPLTSPGAGLKALLAQMWR